MRPLLGLSMLAVLVSMTGCGSGLTKVRGRVHYADGTPVTHGRVVVETTGPASSWGLIRPDGTFEMGTHDVNDGVVPGTLRVFLENTDSFPPPDSGANFVAKPLVHPKYARPETSGLTFEVPRDREWDIVVDRP